MDGLPRDIRLALLAFAATAFTIAVDPSTPSTLYVGASYPGTVWRSTDSGGHWTAPGSRSSPVEIAAPALDATSGILYAVGYANGSNGFFKSADGGRSWAPSGAGLPAGEVVAIAVDPNAPATLLATVYGAFADDLGNGLFMSPNHRRCQRVRRPAVGRRACHPRRERLLSVGRSAEP